MKTKTTKTKEKSPFIEECQIIHVEEMMKLDN